MLSSVTSSFLLFLTFHLVLPADHTNYTLGYLGASNDTDISDQILVMLNKSIACGAELDFNPHNKSIDISIISKVTNQCDVGEAVHHLFDILSGDQKLLALVVFSCTEVLKVIGELAPHFNLTVLGLGSSSAVLRNRVMYPTLQLLSEVENTHSTARVQFIESQGWSQVGTLSEDYVDFTLAADDLDQVSGNSTVRVKKSLTVVSTAVDIAHKIEDLNASDVRIIFIFGSRSVIEEILASMSDQDFFMTRRVIITNHKISEIPEKVDVFYIGSTINQGPKSSHRCEYANVIYSLLAQINAFLLKIPAQMDTADLIEYFNRNFEYHGNYTTSIYRYNTQREAFDLLATSLSGDDKWMTETSNISWSGGTRPLDQKKLRSHVNSVNKQLLYIFGGISAAGIALAIVFFVIGCKYRNVGLIKMSSPIVNSVNILGAICLYASVCILGLAFPLIPYEAYRSMCALKGFLLSIGYSLAFGPMCAKAYRVHYIFTSAHHGKLTRKRLEDRNLLLFIFTLAVIDTIVITSWYLLDPFFIRVEEHIEHDQSDLDITVTSVSYMCMSNFRTRWLGVVYAYKGILLLLGVYLAWTTRHVSIPTLNDSKSIMLNIYVVLGASILVVIVSIFLQQNATLSYGIMGGLILVSTTIMLCILFIPKIVSLLKLPRNLTNAQLTNMVMRGGGLVPSSSNTKRLEVDPAENIKELELQNKVLTAELSELDQEIAKLTRMSARQSIQVTDFLAAELLYILPLPQAGHSLDDPELDPMNSKLTRRYTPKYKIKRRRQQEMLWKYKSGFTNSSAQAGGPMHLGNVEEELDSGIKTSTTDIQEPVDTTHPVHRVNQHSEQLL